MATPRRSPPQMPPEEPAIPLEPAVAKARSAYVRSNVEKMESMMRENKSKEEIQEAVARFAADYPTLFKMVIESPSARPEKLKLMLAMLDRMGTTELTQDQASAIVGQRLYDTFVKPKLAGAGNE